VSDVRVYWLGRAEYRETWALQRSMVAALERGELGASLLLLEHPHVFTLGRRGTTAHVRWDEDERRRHGVDLVWCDRGGDVTYHGPGQLVGYGILDLPRMGLDIIGYIQRLQRSLIDYLAELGIPSVPLGGVLTGVWLPGERGGEPTQKLAAIGIRAHRGLTSHGFALNLTADLEIFNQGILPCGLEGHRATSVAEAGGRRPEVREAADAYLPHFAAAFGLEPRWADVAEIRALPAVEVETGSSLPVL
jgi:lipoyl(octanoyl) transferase